MSIDFFSFFPSLPTMQTNRFENLWTKSRREQQQTKKKQQQNHIDSRQLQQLRSYVRRHSTKLLAFVVRCLPFTVEAAIHASSENLPSFSLAHIHRRLVELTPIRLSIAHTLGARIFTAASAPITIYRCGQTFRHSVLLIVRWRNVKELWISGEVADRVESRKGRSNSQSAKLLHTERG